MAPKKKSHTHIDQQLILSFFGRTHKFLSLKKINHALRPGKKAKKEIQTVLHDLENQGRIVGFGKNKSYALVEKLDKKKGQLEIASTGAGFVRTDNDREEDIYIAPENLGPSRPGDRVSAILLPYRRGKNPEGIILEVVERNIERLPVIPVKRAGKTTYWARPVDRLFGLQLILDLTGVQVGSPREQVFLAQIGPFLGDGVWKGEIVQHLGQEQETRVQETIVKQIKGITQHFPDPVLKQVAGTPEDPAPEDFPGRKDLRHTDFVTIDGETARDFDDAVFVRQEQDRFTLFVAIADVSHYVRPGTPLDLEARKRGNSYYFPRSVEPMLPPELSTGLCSLNPGVDRLVLVAEMDFSSQGARQRAEFYPAVIRSRARLTYSRVKKGVLDQDPGEARRLGPCLGMLQSARSLAEILCRQREQRGSIDFDLPETEILFNDQDHIRDIQPKARHFGHQIIEECMIAANEAVADYLLHKQAPCLFRIHPQPDPEKLSTLFELLKKTELADHVPEHTDPGSLQGLLKKVKPSSLDFLVNRLMLRSMMQAAYAPDNQGHFGLASRAYCHFTSPIRRYADLTVHRSLKQTLGWEQRPEPIEGLPQTGEDLNKSERLAMEAEREITKRLTCIFLQDKIGSAFDGVVVSVFDFGFWVELSQVLAEGMVRVETLSNDYYQYLPKEFKLVGLQTGKTYTLGTRVRVRLANVSLSRQEIDLEIKD